MKKSILKLHSNQLAPLEQSLEEAGAILNKYIWIHDRIFIPRDFEIGKNWPRLILRTEIHATDRPPRFALILKRHIEDSGIDIVNDTEVISYEDAAGIILQLGFTPTREVVRRRQLINWDLSPHLQSFSAELSILNNKGNTNFYLDKVEGLPGYFLKLEASVDQLPTSTVYDFLHSLAGQITNAEISLHPYFNLLER